MARELPRFLALLRGINVGGKNVILKDDLRGCFEDAGFQSVMTYIQSGNVLFRASGQAAKVLTSKVELALAERFNYEARAVVIPESKYRKMLQAAPEEWGEDPDMRHNAMFLLGGATGKSIMKKIDPPKPGIDRVTVAGGVIFWSLSKAGQTRSAMMRVAATPAYQQMTIRNHNTSRKLLQLFDRI